MKSTLWFQASGERFKPSSVSARFDKQHDFGDIKPLGKNAGNPYSYGYCEIQCPGDRSVGEMLPEFLRQLVPIVSAIRDAGADSLEIRALLYASVSATADIRHEDIVRMASLGCDLIVTFYPETPKMKTEPNHAMVPTPVAVTVLACARTAPSTSVAHLVR